MCLEATTNPRCAESPAPTGTTGVIAMGGAYQLQWGSKSNKNIMGGKQKTESLYHSPRLLDIFFPWFSLTGIIIVRG